MRPLDSAVAVFAEHQEADAAIKKLADAGINMKQLSVLGKGYHTDEKVVGFYNSDDRIKFWGKRGAIWGALWGWLYAGIFLFVPTVGPVVVLGYVATVVVAGLEGALALGTLSAVGAALYSSGIPKDSVIKYEEDIKADKFLVTIHGPAEEVARARAILGTFKPARLDVHESAVATEAM